MADLERYPYFIVDNSKTGNDRYTGYDVELLELVAAQSGFTYTIVEVKRNATFDNWENVLYQAVQRYDIVMSYWSKSQARLKTYPYLWVSHLTDSFEMVALQPAIPQRTLASTLFTFLHPFTYELWVVIILLLVVQGVTLYWTDRRFGKTDDGDFEDTHSHLAGQLKGIFLAMSVFCLVGAPNPDTLTGRIQLLFLGFTITVLLAVIIS